MTPVLLGPPLQAPTTRPPIIPTTPETFAEIWYSDTQEFPFVQLALIGAFALYLIFRK
jgi:hypothetical protein